MSYIAYPYISVYLSLNVYYGRNFFPVGFLKAATSLVSPRYRNLDLDIHML